MWWKCLSIVYVRWENLCWQLTFGGALRPSGSKVFLFQWPSKLSLGGLSCSSRACTDAAPHDDLECSGAKQKKINIYIYTYIYIHIYIYVYVCGVYVKKLGEEFPKKLRRKKKTRNNKKKQVENKLATIIFQVGGDLGVNSPDEHRPSSCPGQWGAISKLVWAV